MYFYLKPHYDSTKNDINQEVVMNSFIIGLGVFELFFIGLIITFVIICINQLKNSDKDWKRIDKNKSHYYNDYYNHKQ